MAGKFFTLDEAAERLRISAEQLSEFRQEGKIHGYRDGSSWKFRAEEVERAADELASAGRLSGDSADLGALDDEETLDGQESILVTEEPRSVGETSSSTIIGADGFTAETADSDIQLSADSDIDLTPDSDIRLQADSDVPLMKGEDSDVALMPDESGSAVRLVAGDSDSASDTGKLDGSDSDAMGSDPGIGMDSDVLGMDSDVIAGDSSRGSGDTGELSDPDLDLPDDPLEMATGDSLALGDEEMLDDPISGSKSGSAAVSDMALSAIDDDDDLVLSPSGIGSDLTLDAGDSGIGLSSPGDSGISLEDEPLDLAGSGIDSLELPEEDEDEAIVELDEEADPDAATQLKADDDFLLEPVDMEEDEEESGSQVIALEDSGYADADAATMLGAHGEAAMVAQEMHGGYDPHAAQMMPMHMQAAPAQPEASYSAWNVAGLAIVLIFMVIVGILAADLMRNMWHPTDSSATMADMITSALGMTQ